MSLFSERNNYIERPIQINSVSAELRNRIWNTFQCEIYIPPDGDMEYYTNCIEELMDFFGLIYKHIYTNKDLRDNIQSFREWFLMTEWYVVYDFVEAYLHFLGSESREAARDNLNNVLSWENSGYRIAGTEVIPITNEMELSCITDAQSIPYENVNIHIEKAIMLFSQRQNPDYENSIKESISAVEAICCIITEKKKATLGDVLKKLEAKGIKLHKAFGNAMSSLYGYTSDANGIRHGGIDFTGANCEDAKYMLISCSAFVNYLIEKWEKVK